MRPVISLLLRCVCVCVCVCVGLLQPQLERVAVEALQLCCLLLPPGQRRKLQLLMRMMSRMSQNVDMPRLHQAIGTRTLVKTLSLSHTHTYTHTHTPGLLIVFWLVGGGVILNLQF